MQQMTTDYCNSMETNTTMTLTDTRNNQPYRVRKMPDGKCWMIDNLKLELTNSTILTPSDSNVSTNTQVTLGGSGTYTGNFITSGSMGYDYWAQANPNDPTIAANAPCAQGQMVDPSSTTGCGYLYNWYTATASSGKEATLGGYVTSSICPSGWHLPRGNDGTTAQNEFAVLNSAMYNGSTSGSASTSTAYAKNWWHTGLFAGPRSGQYSSGSFGFSTQGYNGSFWSSSNGYTNSAQYLIFNYTIVYTTTGSNPKYNGFAVRCVS
jgi:uncharacterized protein (TIGR02145 family)